ncbi:MAG: hypothetical protein JNK57_05665 [Planctomycetaceae bacterium]|nr:hypothetical protein [Planctomycetaceae bacterium]
MKPTAEDLLGYLLGALEADEHRRVDRAVSEYPEVQFELARLRERIAPLARLEEVESLSGASGSDFPAGLARRACEFVARESRQLPSVLDRDESGIVAVEPRPSESLVRGSANESRVAVMTPVSGEFSDRRSWQFQDFIVVSAVVMLAAGILAPAILASRNQMRLAACQDNLRRVGMALFNYAEAHDNRFVPIARTGPLNVAGAYAPVLKAGGFIEEDRVFYCGSAVQNGLYEVQETPSLAVLEEAFRENNQQLAELQSHMGGSYGYSLGHYEQDQYVGPMNLGRSFRVMMADAPSPSLANRNSANHDGQGLNILFEDGSVRHSASASIGFGKESIFLNRNGLVAAGADVHDSVIGASNVSAWLSPHFYQN